MIGNDAAAAGGAVPFSPTVIVDAVTTATRGRQNANDSDKSNYFEPPFAPEPVPEAAADDNLA